MTLKTNLKLLARSSVTENMYTPCYFGKFLDAESIEHKIIIPVTALKTPSTLKTFLLERGFPFNTNSIYWKRIYEVFNDEVRTKITLATRPGWIGEIYINSDGGIIGCCKKNELTPMFHPDVKLPWPTEHVSGELNGWIDNVARLAIHSSRLVLAMSASIAGLLINFMGVECGGFHFHGNSSIGKSTCLSVAASIFGDRQFINSWNVTDKAFEELAEAHNDSVLILDELKLLHEDSVTAAQKVMMRIYQLSESRGKTRSKSYQSETSVWNVILLSAGEESLFLQANSGGRKQFAGEATRLIDVPADAGCGFGVFDSLPKHISSSSELADELSQQCQLFHGVAKRSFLKKLTNRMNSDDSFNVKKVMDAYVDEFIEHSNLMSDDGQEIRKAKKFALSYAAGCLAIDFGIFPYTKGQLINAISLCFEAAQKIDKSSIFDVIEVKQRLFDEIKNNNIYEQRKKDKSISKDELDAKGFIKSTLDNKRIISIKTEIVNNLCGSSSVRRCLLDQLNADGLLIKSADDKNTRQITVNGVLLSRRFCLDYEMLPSDIFYSDYDFSL